MDIPKVKLLNELVIIRNDTKKQGKKIVWTNGCYDILHAGHVLYLKQAKLLGDILVVGLNSDKSVKLSKGPNRPIINEYERAVLISALEFVDYVILFDTLSPLNIIKKLKPDIYAKGGDYHIDTINQQERKVVEEYGGKIELLPGVEGISTTHIIENILKVYGK